MKKNDNLEKRMRRNASIEFYRGRAVHGVLERYPFTQEERDIVERAIKSAHREKPLLGPIRKADALLERITAEQKPKTIPKPDDESIAFDIMMFENLLKEQKEKSATQKKSIRYALYIFIVILASLLMQSYVKAIFLR